MDNRGHENKLNTQAMEMARFIAAIDILSSLPLSKAKQAIAHIQDPDVRMFLLTLLDHIHKSTDYNQWLLRDVK